MLCITNESNAALGQTFDELEEPQFDCISRRLKSNGHRFTCCFCARIISKQEAMEFPQTKTFEILGKTSLILTIPRIWTNDDEETSQTNQ
jgi:hypothetical protein